MKYEEIIKLLDAGYSREEILAMKDETKAPETETGRKTAPIRGRGVRSIFVSAGRRGI